ncbi:peptidase domain-containing ABC transporter [Stenotrophomonas sp. CC120222-04]|uniref:peptidase domain-containing ABC transporter n=1 Tax=Stenotrophomonas sp. CC120222-04 TaxID=1378088 RepID=UPI000B62520D|nr:peptidase domain-containing ABC transporter [Stenotrophomonas sp. CC120222-04]SNT83261.1 colicin V processing peptidase. Cysteine peptidase. MEROPS family C39 [Stenotrophomonas sp. CC120222-04]
MDVVRQSESAECGLACMAMVCSHFGRKLSLREARLSYPNATRGMTLHGLVELGGRLGLDCRPLRVDMDQLKLLALPCILHWEFNHFVVLVNVGRRSATLLDPAIGRYKVPLAEFSRKFTGVALEASPSTNFQKAPASRRVSLRQLTGNLVGLKRALAVILGISIALQTLAMVAPFYMQWVVDYVLLSADSDLLIILGVAFGALVVLQVATGISRGWAITHLSSTVNMQWTVSAFRHLTRLPLDFFEKRQLGDVVSRMGSIQAIQKTITTTFVEVFVDGLMATITLLIMAIYSWKLTLVTLLALSMYFIARLASFMPLRSGTEAQLVAGAKQQSFLLESIRGIQSIKIGGKEDSRKSGFQNLVSESIGRDLWVSRFSLLFTGTNQLIFGLEKVAVIWIGASLAMKGVFSVGMLVAYLAYKDQFALRVSALIDRAVEFRMLRLHGERLAEVVLAEPETDDRPGQGVDSSSGVKLEIEGLSFRYGDGEPWIVRNCSFTVEPGQSVAIIGASGAGKTTLIKLLLSVLRPIEGTIKVNGHNIDDMGVSRYRSLIGAVMQDDQLFAGSIRENISFFDNSIDENRILEVAKLAAIHEEISGLPMGYETLIGDMGSTLSGGQKQRIVLARALYRKPKLLILDEATSHLDVRREHLVNEAVKQMDLSRIIVAHRPETIASADRVIVLENGLVSDVARHDRAPIKFVEEATS